MLSTVLIALLFGLAAGICPSKPSPGFNSISFVGSLDSVYGVQVLGDGTETNPVGPIPGFNSTISALRKNSVTSQVLSMVPGKTTIPLYPWTSFKPFNWYIICAQKSGCPDSCQLLRYCNCTCSTPQQAIININTDWSYNNQTSMKAAIRIVKPFNVPIYFNDGTSIQQVCKNATDERCKGAFSWTDYSSGHSGSVSNSIIEPFKIYTKGYSISSYWGFNITTIPSRFNLNPTDYNYTLPLPTMFSQNMMWNKTWSIYQTAMSYPSLKQANDQCERIQQIIINGKTSTPSPNTAGITKSSSISMLPVVFVATMHTMFT